MRRDPRRTERALRKRAVSQGGFFTAAEARHAGYSYRLQHFHRTSGNWHRVDRGLYRFPDYLDSPHDDLVRWSLWSRDRRGRTQAVVSHESALALHDLGDVMPAKIHLTVPPGFRKKPGRGCLVHRAVLLGPEIETGEGFLLTRPLRTLRDVAESDLSPEHLAAAVRDALRKGLVRRRTLLEARVSPHVRDRLRDALLDVQGEVD
jgi:predicted transcriptional regulator of viral defense system